MPLCIASAWLRSRLHQYLAGMLDSGRECTTRPALNSAVAGCRWRAAHASCTMPHTQCLLAQLVGHRQGSWLAPNSCMRLCAMCYAHSRQPGCGSLHRHQRCLPQGPPRQQGGEHAVHIVAAMATTGALIAGSK